MYTNPKGTKYYLHQKEARPVDGRAENIYYFRRKGKEGQNTVEKIPDGYETKELQGIFISKKQGTLAEIGLPILKKVN